MNNAGSFSRWRAGIVNAISIVLAGFFTLFAAVTGSNPGLDISFIGIGMRIASFIIIPATLTCIYLSQRKRSYMWTWLGLVITFLPFGVMFVAGMLDVIVMSSRQ